MPFLEPHKQRFIRFLRWTERYTKTDMVYLASGGFWAILGQFVASLLSFLLAVAMAHFVSKDAYGTYKYIVSVVAIITTFSLTGLGSAVLQSVAHGFEGALEEGFWINLRWSFAVFLGAFGVAAYYFFQGNSVLAIGVLAGGCLSPFLASANLSQSYLAAKKDFKRLNLYFSVVENIIPIASLFVTILLTQNPAIIAFVYFAANTIVTFALYQRIKRLYKPDNAKRDRGLFNYGGHLSVMGILNGVASNIDQIFLFHFLGAPQLAIYNFAVAIPDQAKGPLKTLNQMMQAQFAQRSGSEVRAGIFNKTIWILLVSGIGIAFYIALAPFIYDVFFPTYHQAIFYTQIYSLAYLADSFSPAASYLIVKKKIRAQYVSNVMLSIFRIIALLIGILWWGLLGIVIARIIIRFTGTLFNYALFFLATREKTGGAL